MEESAEPLDTQLETEVDLTALRGVLELLREMKVQAFQGYGISVSFQEEAEFGGFTAKPSPKQEADDGHGTSNRRVPGFGKDIPETRGTFRDPRLWPTQGGRILTFKGGYSE